MDVVFGWELDGLHFPETASGQLAHFNSLISGPSSFLGLLETRLGLRRPAIPRALRIADYLVLLRKQDNGERFFSASLSSDGWATADHLLSLRDELIGAGWNRKAIEGLHKLNELLEVEAQGAISDGFGERLHRVIGALKESRKTIIDRLRIAGRLMSLPFVWRRTIELLIAGGTTVDEVGCNPLISKQRGGLDLQTLQERLNRNDTKCKVNLKGDGSFCVIDADDELQAALFTASWFQQRVDCKDVVLIRGGDCSSLTQMLERSSLPNIGGNSRSRNRAILQVLPLAFEVACRPLDAKKLVELLSVKGGPIPGWIAKKLINALHQAPGIGGTDWNDAWRSCTETQIQRVRRDEPELSKSTAVKLAEEKIADWQLWFAESMSAEDTHKMISAQDADAICLRVQQWAQQRRTTERSLQNLYELAAWQASMLRKLISRNACERIPLTQLQKMIEAVSDYGSSISTTEAADWSLVDRPGQIWGSADTIVWWGFAQSRSVIPPRTVWSDEEFELMQRNGISLERPEEKLSRESLSWRMAILQAQERVILVKPRLVAGERAIAHPLWDEITSMIDSNSLQQITRHASDLFRNREIEFANSLIRCEQQTLVALPGALRTWTISSNLVKQRANESYSSINTMLGCPLAWVLQYGGGMWQPKILNLPEKQQLLGNLAHATVKKLYETKKCWEPDEARVHASSLLASLIPEMAASLLMPGMSPQLREATDAIPSAVFHLVTLLRDAGARVEGCEIPLRVPLTDSTSLGGNIDMIIQLPSGDRAVLDFKWTSAPYWYRRQLRDGKSLQLAIYSWLVAQSDDTPAHRSDRPNVQSAGYFMFRHGELFFTEEGIFPQYTLVRKMARDLSETFKISLESYEREWRKVTSGTVVAAGIVDNTIDVFQGASLVEPPCNFCEFGHFCGKRELE